MRVLSIVLKSWNRHNRCIHKHHHWFSLGFPGHPFYHFQCQTQAQLYRQCSPRRVMDTTIEELEKCECVSSVMNNAPVLNIEREKMGCLKIFERINYGVYVFICYVYSNILKEFTQHAFVYDSYFTTKVKSSCQGAIIDNIRYAPICVLEGKDR